MATIGYIQNNPGNLEVGSFQYDGEIDSPNDYRNFSSMPYGIRAWIMNLYEAIDVHDRTTYAEYLDAYAPLADGNSEDYGKNVVGSDFELDGDILTDASNLQKLFFDQAKQEIGSDASKITSLQFNQGLQLFNNSVPGFIQGLINEVSGSITQNNSSGFYITLIVFFIFLYVLRISDK